MKIEIKRTPKPKKEKKVKKVERKSKVKSIHVGLKQKSTFFLWSILLTSLSFGVYKNFTAIDTHTIKEKEVVQLKLVDTTKIQSFVENFVKTYYAWQQTPESLEKRNKELENYLTPALQKLNQEMIRPDIPTTSTVSDVQFWSIEQLNKETYTVLFSVEQRIIENKKTKQITSTYRVGVYVGEEDNMAILINPTVDAKPMKSIYNPKEPEADGTINSRTTEEITSFLETFFRLYPKASQKELDYYVSKQVLKPINKDFVFSELVNPIYQKNGDKVKIFVYVKYLNQETKAAQLSQFEFMIEKSDNWYICE